MRDGCQCQIRLIHSSLKNDVTIYHLLLETEGQQYTTAIRYSKLRTISSLLP